MQLSTAVMVKVRVIAQGVPLSRKVTFTVGVPLLSVAVTWACTLALSGRVAGLQPKLAPVGTLVIVGGVVSFTVIVWVAVATFPQLSDAVHVRVMVTLHEPAGLAGVCE